jgi:hypothetical protein
MDEGGEFIGLDPNEQDPINGVGGEGSQMVVPGAKQPFLFDLPTFVKVKVANSVRARAESARRHHRAKILKRGRSEALCQTISAARR